MNRWTRKIMMAVSLLAAAAGCAGGRVGIYANMPPPPLRSETLGPSSGSGYVWLRGYWGWDASVYVWRPGRWERPPAIRRRWEDGRWERRGNRYQWRDGRWR